MSRVHNELAKIRSERSQARAAATPPTAATPIASPAKKLESNIEAQLEQIAKTTLRLETLETRHSDGLDFHDVAVWDIKRALRAAYEAGRNSAQH